MKISCARPLIPAKQLSKMLASPEHFLEQLSSALITDFSPLLGEAITDLDSELTSTAQKEEENGRPAGRETAGWREREMVSLSDKARRIREYINLVSLWIAMA